MYCSTFYCTAWAALAKHTGVDKDFDADPTGVEVDTGACGETYEAVTDAYNKAYDAVPQEHCPLFFRSS